LSVPSPNGSTFPVAFWRVRLTKYISGSLSQGAPTALTLGIKISHNGAEGDGDPDPDLEIGDGQLLVHRA
jgi:hypothetical protein